MYAYKWYLSSPSIRHSSYSNLPTQNYQSPIYYAPPVVVAHPLKPKFCINHWTKLGSICKIPGDLSPLSLPCFTLLTPPYSTTCLRDAAVQACHYAMPSPTMFTFRKAICIAYHTVQIATTDRVSHCIASSRNVHWIFCNAVAREWSDAVCRDIKKYLKFETNMR